MKTNSYKLFGLAILINLVLVTSACTPTPSSAPALTPITVQLLAPHKSDYAGFYVADQKGYYAAEGLSVTFLEGGTNVDYLAPVVNGTAQFGVASADALIVARAEGKKLRAIATIFRRSPMVFVALADSGIKSPQDFIGKVIRIGTSSAPLHAMTMNVGVRSDQYTEVVLPSDIAAFASGKVPVWSMYLTNFLVPIQQAGYKVNIIYPDDYGVHFYADSIFTTDEMISKNPDQVTRFLRATLKGWTFAVENPADVGPLVRKYAPKADVVLENAKMIASLPLINTGEDHIGWMKSEIWAGMEQTLREQSVLTTPLEVTQVYTMRFLEEIYGK
jgi:NitT/TauT family transport system substrate-binding protein